MTPDATMPDAVTPDTAVPDAPSAPPCCANCGAATPAAFCAACGQKAEPLRQPLYHFAREGFVEFVGLDGRLWRTFGRLLAQPGRLTEDYLQGRRQEVLRPLKVYLTSTLLFFFLLSVIDPAGRVEGALDAAADSTATVAGHLAAVDAALAVPRSRAERTADSLNARVRALTAALDSATAGPGELDSRAPRLAALEGARNDVYAALGELSGDGVEIDARKRRDDRRRLVVQHAILATLPPDSLIRPADVARAAAVVYPDTADIDLPPWLAGSASLATFRQAGTPAERMRAGTALARAAIGKVPTVMFLLLPLFALGLKGLYARRGWYYSEHVVFGLHTHAFAFVVFAAVAALVGFGGGGGWAGWLSFVLTMAVPVYFVVAQKRVYGQSWRKTLAKAVLLGLVYNTALAFGLVAAFALAAVE